MTREEEIRDRLERYARGIGFGIHAPNDIDYLLKENQRLRDANNTMAAYLQSLANPEAWNGRTYIRGFREPWVYADDALRYAGIEEREPLQALEGDNA